MWCWLDNVLSAPLRFFFFFSSNGCVKVKYEMGIGKDRGWSVKKRMGSDVRHLCNFGESWQCTRYEVIDGNG